MTLGWISLGAIIYTAISVAFGMWLAPRIADKPRRSAQPRYLDPHGDYPHDVHFARRRP